MIQNLQELHDRVSISSKSEEWDWAIWINTWADKLITSLFNNKSSQIKQIIDCPEERLQCSCLLAHRHNMTEDAPL